MLRGIRVQAPFRDALPVTPRRRYGFYHLITNALERPTGKAWLDGTTNTVERMANRRDARLT
jgi:hypothetical protein